MLALKPDGVFLSNGPGDPAALDYAHRLRDLWARRPIFGICLGHQMLGLRLRRQDLQAQVRPSRRQPAREDLATGKVAITSQNHGFAVDPDSLPSDVEVTHINLNDQTVEGLRHKELPGLQRAVSSRGRARDRTTPATFFAEFARLIERERGQTND